MQTAINEEGPRELAPASLPASPQPSSKSLRLWLTVLTIGAVVVCLLGVPATLVAAGSMFFAADDPKTTMQDIWRLQGWVWGTAALFFILLGSGVVGGWLAYRRGHAQLSLGLSLISAAPVLACVGSIALLFLLNTSSAAAVWVFGR